MCISVAHYYIDVLRCGNNGLSCYLNYSQRIEEAYYLRATSSICTRDMTGRSYSQAKVIGVNLLRWILVVSIAAGNGEYWDGKRELPHLADLANALAAGAVGGPYLWVCVWAWVYR